MNYRRTYAADRIAIKEMCEKEGILYDGREPLIGFVAIGEDGREFVGCSYAHKAIVIDPFICKVPIAALKLFYLTSGAVQALDFNNTIVQVSKDNSKLIDELGRLGFERIASKFALFKKVI